MELLGEKVMKITGMTDCREISVRAMKTEE